MITLYNELPNSKKIEIRARLLRMMSKRKHILDMLENSLIKSLKDNIKDIDLTLKSKISIEKFMFNSKNVNKYLKEWFKWIKN